ncbi:MAG: helix-turn-helix transcriptional regulator, partial [Hyphomicrobiaceae bacterium]
LPDAFMTPGEVSSRWVLPIGQKGTEFCLWLLSILNRNSKVLELTCDPMAAALFRDRFLLALGNVLTLALNDDSIPTSARQYCRYGLARRANDIVSNSLRETISSEEVARELGVSRQILWLAFRDVMNISPHQYILKRKLQEVRRDLINTTTSQENVSDIAAKYGFQDFSRFGQFYRRMYGELPSKTLSSAKP